jgi:transposase-like protein
VVVLWIVSNSKSWSSDSVNPQVFNKKLPLVLADLCKSAQKPEEEQMKYYEAMRALPRNKFDVRLKMVKIAENRGISEAARIFETTRNTVRKWLVRYREEGLNGLKERSRAPKSIPQKAQKRR